MFGLSEAGEKRQEAVSTELKCRGCGSSLQYAPGTKALGCAYCGARNPITDKSGQVQETDFERFVDELYDLEDKIEVSTVTCDACAAAVTFPPHVTAGHCPYCAADIVVKCGSTSTLLKPKAQVPFAIAKEKAQGLFQGWIASRWFAPSDLKKRAASGQVENAFDDILVSATTSLPGKYVEKLEPWDLQALTPFNESYLSGFQAQSYQVDLKGGMLVAKQRMEPVIDAAIRGDIGGDEQRIGPKTTCYSGVTFKHILLPIWISSYRYRDKAYRFLVNGQTGELQGERPFSALKITLAVLGALALALLGMLAFSK